MEFSGCPRVTDVAIITIAKECTNFLSQNENTTGASVIMLAELSLNLQNLDVHECLNITVDKANTGRLIKSLFNQYAKKDFGINNEDICL